MNLLTVSETAALLRCSTRKLHRLRKLDGFPQRYTIGGSFRWDASEVEAWLRMSARDAAPVAAPHAQNPAKNAEQPTAAPVAAPQAPAPAQGPLLQAAHGAAQPPAAAPAQAAQAAAGGAA